MLFHAYTLCLISFSLLSQVFVFFKIYFAVLIFSWAHFSIFTVSHLILLISSSLIYFPFSSCSHFCSFFLPSSLSNFFLFRPKLPFAFPRISFLSFPHIDLTSCTDASSNFNFVSSFLSSYVHLLYFSSFFLLQSIFHSSLPISTFSLIPPFLLSSSCLIHFLFLFMSFLLLHSHLPPEHFRPPVKQHLSSVVCAWPLIHIIMRRIPTSHFHCTLPHLLPTSFPGSHVFPGTQRHPPLSPLCSPGPRVARSIPFHHTSNGPNAIHAGRTQGPEHLHGEACVVWYSSVRGAGGDTQCYEQMSLGAEQQAGGMPQGKRDIVRDPPLQPCLGKGERQEINLSFSKHSTFALLCSPHLAAQLPLLLPILTVHLGN